jgi:hypothetical protein
VVPLGELAPQVVVIEEAPLLEERPLDPTNEVLDRPLLLGAARPAQLDAEAEVEHHRAERRVPLGDGAVLGRRQSDGLGPIEHRQQRQTTPGGEVLDHRADQGFDPLSLSTRLTSTQREYFRREAKKCTRRCRPSRYRTSTWPKSCCENSPASPSNPDHRPNAIGTQFLDQREQRALAAGVAP